MAKTQKSEEVRYQVLGPVYVGDNYIDPKKRKDVFVHAAPGLEGKHLKLAPEKAPPAPEKTDGDETGKSGDAGQDALTANAQSATASKDLKPGQTKPAA